MKTYKLIAICIASLFFGGLQRRAGRSGRSARKSSDQRECKLRRTDHYCQKRYSDRVHPFGRSDFLTFFSGEAGSKYEYRERETIDPSQIKSSMLNFSIWFQYGNPSTTLEKHVYISDEFTGLYKDNFEADSLLVEQFEKDGKWKELVPQSAFPTAAVGNADLATPYSFDMKEYMGKRIAIAICYRGIDNTVAPIQDVL